MSTAHEAKAMIQGILGTAQDGVIGPHSIALWDALLSAPDDAPWPIVANPDAVHAVIATSFADPADVRAFRRCKKGGGSDQECFKVGDNGIGKWGDDCSEGSGPKCALPPEDWLSKWGVNARHAKVLVTIRGKSVVCKMDDTMPHKANITNGAGIDLNPDACAALGVSPPLRTDATWQWA